jgi:hypothetical protein
MPLYVSFFITSNKKRSLEGSYAFHNKPPGRYKLWKKNLLWTLRAASSSYELPALPPPSQHVATPAKIFTAVTAKIMCNIEFIFVLIKLLTNLLLRKVNFRKWFCIITILLNIFARLNAFFVTFFAFSLYFCGKNQC